jgi:hypothetical protein
MEDACTEQAMCRRLQEFAKTVITLPAVGILLRYNSWCTANLERKVRMSYFPTKSHFAMAEIDNLHCRGGNGIKIGLAGALRRSGRNFETVVLDQFTAVLLKMILDRPNSCHLRGNSCSTVSEIPVMCQEFSDIHDFKTGSFGFPELAFLESGKGDWSFRRHVGGSVG